VVVILTGFVGLASICATLAVVPEIALAPLVPQGPLLVFGVCAALLILYTHRANVTRMRAGTEPRAKRLWLLGARRGTG
jgi:glycerol-3-phosphate acyltransferase PlsY